MDLFEHVIGFTGTKHGMTHRQKVAVGDLLDETLRMLALRDIELLVHHGDCIGADFDFDVLCRVRSILRHIHPGHAKNGHRPTAANCITYGGSFKDYAPLPYLTRDAHIVRAVTLFLVVCPRSTSEELRSGTWTTYRMAKRAGKERRIVWPDGTITVEKE